MNPNDWQRYRNHVASSSSMVRKVAAHLLSKGHTVQVPPTHVAKHQHQRKDMVDDGDLFILKRMEVKAKSVQFTCREDYPYRSLIICNKYSFDHHKGMPPAFYFIVAADGEHVAVIDVTKTKDKWWAEKRKDKRYEDVEEVFYFIDKKNVWFEKLDHGEN